MHDGYNCSFGIKKKVTTVFEKAFTSLEDGGKLVLTFRDLSHELIGADRFLPVKSDDNIIFTCFLEYEPDTVKVHDIIYKKISGGWELFKSFYRKLRLSENWITEEILKCGFIEIENSNENGLITVIAIK